MALKYPKHSKLPREGSTAVNLIVEGILGVATYSLKWVRSAIDYTREL